MSTLYYIIITCHAVSISLGPNPVPHAEGKNYISGDGLYGLLLIGPDAKCGNNNCNGYQGGKGQNCDIP